MGKPSPELLTNMDTSKVLRPVARVFKSLGDEHRLRILALLHRYGELTVTAIGEALHQSQPAVSHHLSQLKTAGLVDFRRDGKFNFYRLDRAGLIPLFDLVVPAGGPVRVSIGGIDVAAKRKG